MNEAPWVFLAAPYSQWMDNAIGGLLPQWKLRLDAVRQALLASGARVFSAHHSESWGKDWRASDLCTPIDFEAMLRTDVVCALVGDPPSGGVAVELGWASALGKPILLVRSPGAVCSPLIAGLGSITSVQYVNEPVAWRAAEIDGITRRVLELARVSPTNQRIFRFKPEFCSSDECRHGGPTTVLRLGPGS